MEQIQALQRNNLVKMGVAALLTALCMYVFQSKGTEAPNLTPAPFRTREAGVTHVLVTGGAGFIGSHATLRLLTEGKRVTIVDNLSRGNLGAIKVLRELAKPHMLQFVHADLGDAHAVNRIFSSNAIDVVIHFAAVAYVGESMAEPLRYFNVIGSDPEGRLGEAPRPELRHHGRITGACFDAALGNIPGLKIMGTNYKTPDGTCIRDYIHVTDLVDAHLAAMSKQVMGEVKIYNKERRPGDYAEVYSDPSKILKELGWKARYVNLEESLGMAWNWRKNHPHGYEVVHLQD
eukprot:jgi/Mesen1/10813/ME000093S10338